jgi:hypothetical protein
MLWPQQQLELGSKKENSQELQYGGQTKNWKKGVRDKYFNTGPPNISWTGISLG